MPRVFFIDFSIASGEIFIVSLSISTNTGLAPHLRTAVAEDGKLNDGIIISSFSLKSLRCMPFQTSVPELVNRIFTKSFSSKASHFLI